MLREMDFIEGDWAALFWALGGAKTLFRHLEAPMSNPSHVPSRTQALMKNSRRGALTIYACCFGMIVSFGWFIFIFPNPVQRIGSTLTAAAAVYLGCQVFERRNRKLRQKFSLRFALHFTEQNWSGNATFTVGHGSGRPC
jgi:hypothetical protein